MKFNDMVITYDYAGLNEYKSNRQLTQLEGPNICPMCFVSLNPVYISSALISETQLDVSFLCRNCEGVFISKYSGAFRQLPGRMLQFYTSKLLISHPKGFRPEKFHKTISETSPVFEEIYNQALNAESMALNQISGVGYRKALEFLVKDYAICKKPEMKDKIQATSLVNCIKTYIEHPKIKGVIERTAWLGNDETHYLRHYSVYDVKTLKDLIELSINWIILDLYSEEIIEEIPHPSAQK